ncbi:heterodisulfide reductase, subunit B, partial [bacterium]
MRISYYPGCTLKSTAKNFEISAIAVAKELGIEFVELSRWNCCGTVYSMTSDDVMHQLAPIRNLIRVKEDGFDRVVTLCSMCFNTLKRANILVQRDREKLDKINDFMYLENIDYAGDVEVLHFLEILRDDVGWDEIR